MLIYGICVDEIKNNEINWDKVENLLESYDSSLYGDFKEYVNYDYDDSETPEEQEYWKKEWFLAYDSMGYHGLGAFLHDVIEEEEHINLDMGYSNGFVLGLSPDLPWYYPENIRNLTNDKFCALMTKYVKMISDHAPTIQMWDCSDD